MTVLIVSDIHGNWLGAFAGLALDPEVVRSLGAILRTGGYPLASSASSASGHG